MPRQSPSELSDEQRTTAVLRMVPRLLQVSETACATFSLLDGVNRAMSEYPDIQHGFMVAASGYRQACASLLVVQLNALLDRDEKKVSFQAVFRHLSASDVVSENLVHHAAAKMDTVASWFPDHCRQDLKTFKAIYGEIDWSDLHGRLKHFRDHAVAHIFEGRFQKTVNYGEVCRLVSAVARMGRALEFLIRPSGFGGEMFLQSRGARNAEVWRTAFKHMPADERVEGFD